MPAEDSTLDLTQSQLPTPPFSANITDFTKLGTISKSYVASIQSESTAAAGLVHDTRLLSLPKLSPKPVNLSLAEGILSPPSTGPQHCVKLKNPKVYMDYQCSSAPGRENSSRRVQALVSIKVDANEVPDHDQNLESCRRRSIPHQACHKINERPHTSNNYTGCKNPSVDTPGFTVRPITATVCSQILTEQKIAFLQKKLNNWNQGGYEETGVYLTESPVHISISKIKRTFRCYLFERVLILESACDNSSTAKQRDCIKATFQTANMTDVQELFDAEGRFIRVCLIADSPFAHFDCRFEDEDSAERWIKLLTRITRPPQATKPTAHLATTGLHETVQEVFEALPTIPPGFKEARSTRTSSTTTTINVTPIIVPNQPQIAPALSTKDVSRVPVDLVVIMPVSSSMKGLRLASMKKFLCTLLVDKVNSFDRFGLVLYGLKGGASAEIHLGQIRDPVSCCKIVKEVEAQERYVSGQDVQTALQLACRMFGERSPRHCLSHIMLLSDSAHLVPDLSETIVPLCKAQRLMVHSFGYGPTHDTTPLVTLANQTYGSYNFVRDFVDLHDSFVACFDGFTAISHVDLCIHLTVPISTDSAKIVSIIGANRSKISTDGRSAKIWIPSLCYGQSRDVLVNLDVDTVLTSGGQTVAMLQAATTFRHLTREGCFVKLRKLCSLSIPSTELCCTTDSFNAPIRTRQCELLLCDTLLRILQLMAGVQKMAALHAISEFQRLLRALTRSLPFQPEQASVLMDLHTDLDQIFTLALSEQQFEQVGRKRVIKLIEALKDQRAWTVDFNSTQRYVIGKNQQAPRIPSS